MRILLAILLLTYCPNLLGQESYRTFNEVNPALENLQYENSVFRNIHNNNAVFNYFHFHTNRISRKVITGIDITTKSLDLKEKDVLTTVVKANYNFPITRKVSIAAGLGMGVSISDLSSNSLIIPGIAMISRRFSIGYNSNLASIKSNLEWQHSTQAIYFFKIPYGNKDNKTYKGSYAKSLLINLSYLNFWRESEITNQYLVGNLKLNNLIASLGVNNQNQKEFNPLFGMGIATSTISVSFQTVFNKNEISEMQVSLKHIFPSFIRKRRTFINITTPNF